MPKMNSKKETVSKHITLEKLVNEKLKEESKQYGSTVNETIDFIISDYFRVKDAEEGNVTLKEIVYRLNDQNEALRKILAQNTETLLKTYYRLDDFLRSFEEPFEDDEDDYPIDNS